MRIIKNGKSENKLRIFACNRCGCEFEADSNEYSRESTFVFANIYGCRCPQCGNGCVEKKGNEDG